MLSEEEGEVHPHVRGKRVWGGADAANLAENFMNSREHFVGPKKSICKQILPPNNET
jgi:hypothetical protein